MNFKNLSVFLLIVSMGAAANGIERSVTRTQSKIEALQGFITPLGSDERAAGIVAEIQNYIANEEAFQQREDENATTLLANAATEEQNVINLANNELYASIAAQNLITEATNENIRQDNEELARLTLDIANYITNIDQTLDVVLVYSIIADKLGLTTPVQANPVVTEVTSLGDSESLDALIASETKFCGALWDLNVYVQSLL